MAGREAGKADAGMEKEFKADRVSTTKIFEGARKENLQDVYRLGKKIGAGKVGVVYECQDKKTGQVRCVKTICKSRLVTRDNVEDVQREVAIMHHLSGHPNVVEIYDTFEDKHNVYIVMELCRGGDLFDILLEKSQGNGRTFHSERDAAALVKTILQVVKHCQSLEVVHRDLKPENFIMTKKGPDGVLKAVDFGLSTFIKPGHCLRRHCGSPFYMAPEVVRCRPSSVKSSTVSTYGAECDIWSVGCIMYTLLCGSPPFRGAGPSPKDTFKAILKGEPDVLSHPWPYISGPGKALVSWMLELDPKRRPTVTQALNHPWVSEKGAAPDAPLDPAVMSRMKEFTSMARFKQLAVQAIVDSLREDEIEGLNHLFREMDRDGGGTITLEELRDGLRRRGSQVSDAELQRIMQEVDVDGNGVIEYNEFLAATLHLSKIEKDENLSLAFARFDADGSGTISLDELVLACKEFKIAKDEAVDMMKSADLNKDGKIDYDEFVTMMRKAQGGVGRP
eukprot:TRINITY_DN1492_c1_g1_i1.p1 TRINITY_DN1492_c1_g1~~TRINITY_DN1492_c1_g1_i1.p1  ORF type:complete len:506 (-),score=88.59 TRINITY_DN1492_c1_g1_i1:1473-2990(-)